MPASMAAVAATRPAATARKRARPSTPPSSSPSASATTSTKRAPRTNTTACTSSRRPASSASCARLAGVRCALAYLLVLFAGSALAQADPAIVAKLRHGGYVLYLRHASTDFGQNDSRMTSYEDCANQRNLTDKGRNESRAL